MPYVHAYADREPTRADIDAWSGVTLIEFGAPWCPHCIGAQPLLKEALLARSDVRHLKIEDGPGRLLGRSFRVKLWPSMIVMRDGMELARVVRPASQEEIARVLSSS
jgi:thioredoxin 1